MHADARGGWGLVLTRTRTLACVHTGLLLKSKCPSVPAENFTALTFLDHNRARGQIRS